MKIKVLIQVTFFLIFLTGRAQIVYYPMPDSAAQWNFNFHSGFCSADADYSITITGDTLINAQVYHKLNTPYLQVNYNNAGCTLMTTGYKGAFRQDTNAKKVFFVPPFTNAEQLLYDFTMQVGDTVKGYLETFVSPADTVQSIDSVLAGANYHKRWKINSCYGMDIIEGIGSTYGLIEISPGCTTDQPSRSLTCFSKNGTSLYPATSTICDLISSVNAARGTKDEINNYPNPFSYQTKFKVNRTISEASLKIYHLFGKQVKEINNITGEMFLLKRDNLPDGLYFFKLEESGHLIGTGKLVVAD